MAPAWRSPSETRPVLVGLGGLDHHDPGQKRSRMGPNWRKPAGTTLDAGAEVGVVALGRTEEPGAVVDPGPGEELEQPEQKGPAELEVLEVPRSESAWKSVWGLAGPRPKPTVSTLRTSAAASAAVIVVVISSIMLDIGARAHTRRLAAMMRIDVWSDVACPWCYVGKRNLEAALGATGIEAESTGGPSSSTGRAQGGGPLLGGGPRLEVPAERRACQRSSTPR